MNQPNPIVKVVMGLPKTNKGLLASAKSILAALTNNARFPSPPVALTAFASDIAAYDKTETAASDRTPATTTARNEAKAKVLQDIRLLHGYVQGVVETMTNDTLSAVESSGFRVKKQTLAHKQALVVLDGPTSGSVDLVAKAVAIVATYFWQSSLDGKTWTSLPETMQAKTTVTGLTVGQTYSFRFRALTRKGATDYGQVVTHVVK